LNNVDLKPFVFDDFLDRGLDVVLVVTHADDVWANLSQYSEKVQLLVAEKGLVDRLQRRHYLSALVLGHHGLSALSLLNCPVSGDNYNEAGSRASLPLRFFQES
jgi:hypothetical protein